MKSFNPLLKLLSLLCLLLPLSPGAYAQESLPFQDLRLRLRIEPLTGYIQGNATISRRLGRRFYLHKNLRVLKILSQGREIPFRRGADGETFPSARNTSPILLQDEPGEELLVEYEGTLASSEGGVTGVQPESVELALPSGWFPLFPEPEPFTFSLDIDLPSSFVPTSNGRKESLKLQKGRTRFRSRSFLPGKDIVLIAAPDLNSLQERRGGVATEVFYLRAQPEEMKGVARELTSFQEKTRSLFGDGLNKTAPRLVCLPHQEGYSASPLLIVPEESFLGTEGDPWERARLYHNLFYHVSRLGWTVSDSNTQDDWINEALAEYTALLFSRERFGEGFAEEMRGFYVDQLRKCVTSDSIAETGDSSPDRTINRRYKAVLLFLEGESKFGQESLLSLLKRLLRDSRQGWKVTTDLFLEECKEILGEEQESFFQRALYRQESPPEPSLSGLIPAPIGRESPSAGVSPD